MIKVRDLKEIQRYCEEVERTDEMLKRSAYSIQADGQYGQGTLAVKEYEPPVQPKLDPIQLAKDKATKAIQAILKEYRKDMIAALKGLGVEEERNGS